ncbi:P-loop containing nucleoside triphosphate hydrolase protein [Amylocystis lapponica]|nr:P-loop containing nucleoside triphosphate hydrolase protein [Amylocystis lapponica]
MQWPLTQLFDTLIKTWLTTSTTPQLNGAFPGSPAKRVGLSPAYASSGHLAAVAIATYREILVIQLAGKHNNSSTRNGRDLLQTMVLCNPDLTLYAFTLGPFATSLYHDHRLRVLNAVDVQTACSGQGRAASMTPLAAVEFVAGDQVPIFKENIEVIFQDHTYEVNRPTPFALRAWLAGYMMSIGDMEERFHAVKRVNTRDMDDSQLAYVAQLARGDQYLNSKKSTSTKHEFTVAQVKQGKGKFRAERFNQRFMKGGNIEMQVRDESGSEFILDGRTTDVRGRTADIRAVGNLEGKTITSVSTVGGEAPTMAEQQKATIILDFLQGTADLFKNPFLKYIWHPSDDFTWPEGWDFSTPIPEIQSSRPLNDSQGLAVEHMLSPTPISVIHGPPGTGKTSVIAAAVCSASAAGRGGIWLAAQSNVAVKNIAEKLADVGFLNFRVLVSVDFHLEWHEHLYKKINKNIIRSDQFKNSSFLLQDCQTLIIDEASQISLADYMPLSSISTIRKMCFIGDDKQLPPYGQEEAEDIRSIFEVSHLRASAIFLDIQYRMPPQIGEFISDNKMTACLFVDVDGREQPNGTSWMNQLERQAVLKIAAKLQNEGKSFRFITPYDAQRSAMEEDMKRAGLRWADKCFNVDSFQGMILFFVF